MKNVHAMIDDKYFTRCEIKCEKTMPNGYDAQCSVTRAPTLWVCKLILSSVKHG